MSVPADVVFFYRLHYKSYLSSFLSIPSDVIMSMVLSIVSVALKKLKPFTERALSRCWLIAWDCQ
jgi:hypothetical protein